MEQPTFPHLEYEGKRCEPRRELFLDWCDKCLELVSEDLADDNNYLGRCLPLPVGDHRQGSRRMVQGGRVAMPALRQTALVEASSCRGHQPVHGRRTYPSV